LSARAPQPAPSPEPLAAGLVLGEYAATARTFGWGMKELIPVARTSIDSCFAEEGRRQHLVRAPHAFGDANAVVPG
jgi:adenosine deaminase